MAPATRIPVNSLLNNDSQGEIPATPSPMFVLENWTLRLNSQTPSTIGTSPSPSLSESSISSNTYYNAEPARHGRRRTSGASTRHRYRPYCPDQGSRAGKPTRDFRPSYNMEEAYFIWYHRLDLSLGWPEIMTRFNRQFKGQRRGCQGFQCKFYRFLQEHGLPSVRGMARGPNALARYALRTLKPNVWYPWMETRVTRAPQ